MKRPRWPLIYLVGYSLYISPDERLTTMHHQCTNIHFTQGQAPQKEYFAPTGLFRIIIIILCFCREKKKEQRIIMLVILSLFFAGLFTGCFVSLFTVYAILAHLSGIFSSGTERDYMEIVYPIFRWVFDFSQCPLLSFHPQLVHACI